MAMVMDSMARDLLLPSQDMDIMVMDMDTMDMVMAMVMDSMARDLLMPSQDMDIMVMDSMVKQICCSFLEFSTNEVDQRDPVKRNTLFIQLKKKKNPFFSKKKKKKKKKKKS